MQINFFWQPKVYLPFLILRSVGPGARYLNGMHLVTVGGIFVVSELLTAMYLFFSRFLILQGYGGVPLKWSWHIAVTLFLLIITFFFFWNVAPNTTSVVTHLVDVGFKIVISSSHLDSRNTVAFMILFWKCQTY